MTLSWQNMTYKPSKLGQTDLVFGLVKDHQEIVHVGLQVCIYTCSGYDLGHPG